MQIALELALVQHPAAVRAAIRQAPWIETTVALDDHDVEVAAFACISRCFDEHAASSTSVQSAGTSASASLSAGTPAAPVAAEQTAQAHGVTARIQAHAADDVRTTAAPRRVRRVTQQQKFMSNRMHDADAARLVVARLAVDPSRPAVHAVGAAAGGRRRR